MTCEIIIPTRERPGLSELLERNLPAVLAEAGRIGAQVAVVFDGPPYDSGVSASIRQVRLPVAGGFGRAVNEGVASSSADTIVVLNNDMQPGNLSPLLDGWTDTEFARTASCLNEAQGGRDESPSRWVLEDGLLRIVHPCLSGEPAPKPGAAIAHAHGGASAYSRSKWMDLGGYSELYLPAYGEDVDLSFRAWKRGWTVTWRPEAVIRHQSGATTGALFSKEEREQMVERHRLLFHLAGLGDRDLTVSRDRAFQNILSSGYLEFSRWRLKQPLLWALARTEAAQNHRQAIARTAKLSDREVVEKSGGRLPPPE